MTELLLCFCILEQIDLPGILEDLDQRPVSSGQPCNVLSSPYLARSLSRRFVESLKPQGEISEMYERHYEHALYRLHLTISHVYI